MTEKNLIEPALPPRSAALSTLLDPDIFRAIFLTCKAVLLAHSGNRLIRDKVYDLSRSLRQVSLRKHGHETSFEESALTGLLKDTDYGREDAVAGLKETPIERLYRLDKLGNSERNAASLIEHIWETFDRFLGARSARLDQGGGGSGSFSGVIPMSASLTRSYTKFYAPWYLACRNRPAQLVGTRKIRPVDVVFQVVVHHQTIDKMADAYGVKQQDIIEILKGELLSLASRMDDDDNSALPLGGLHDSNASA